MKPKATTVSPSHQSDPPETKKLTPPPRAGANLRIAIVHARWNTPIISALVAGARKSLLGAGVAEANITTADVPGSYELPLAVRQVHQSSKIQASTLPAVTDLLLSASSSNLASLSTSSAAPSSSSAPPRPFDAIIAIGVLIKGETMHFEYIADAVSHGLMRVQLDTGVPIVFGLLTVLSEEQGMARAGLTADGHCHGEDWGAAAVELAVKNERWSRGKT